MILITVHDIEPEDVFKLTPNILEYNLSRALNERIPSRHLFPHIYVDVAPSTKFEDTPLIRAWMNGHCTTVNKKDTSITVPTSP